MREEFYSSLPSLFRRYPPQGYTSSNHPIPAAPGQQGASLDAEGLRVRVAAFHQQIEAWIGSGRLGVPCLPSQTPHRRSPAGACRAAPRLSPTSAGAARPAWSPCTWRRRSSHDPGTCQPPPAGSSMPQQSPTTSSRSAPEARPSIPRTVKVLCSECHNAKSAREWNAIRSRTL